VAVELDPILADGTVGGAEYRDEDLVYRLARGGVNELAVDEG
jgi:hypothetical protein